MTEFIRLPVRVAAHTVDVRRLVSALSAQEAVLDWSDVTELDHDTAQELLGPFASRIDILGDVLGIGALPNAIEAEVLWALGVGPRPSRRPAAWVIVQKPESAYDDREGRHYEYKTSIPNGRRVTSGDRLVFVLPEKDSKDGRRVFGVATVSEIEQLGDDRLRALYADYLAIDPPATFNELGGDPRPNTSNSINRVPMSFADAAAALAGVEVSVASPTPCELPDYDLATPAGVRDAFDDLFRRDLLGPACGPEEEVLESRVTNRYVVGTLAPRGREAVSELVEDDELAGAGDGSEEGSAESAAAPKGTLFSSSIGLTFGVGPDARGVTVHARWGSYERVESDLHFNEDDQPLRVWKRRPHHEVYDVDVTRPGPVRFPEGDAPNGVAVRGVVRPPDDAENVLVTLFLVNEQEQPTELKDSAWVFQPELEITAADGISPVFVRRDHERDTDFQDPDAVERATLELLHRRHAEFAVGHGVAVHADAAADPWDDAAEGWDRAIRVATAVIPSYDVPVTETPSNDELASEFPDFDAFELDMGRLAAMPREELLAVLRRIPTTYGQWIERQKARLDPVTGDPELRPYRGVAALSLDKCEKVRRRLEEGIDVLADPASDLALDAFRFANTAMRLQLLRSVYALRRRRGEEVEYAQVEAEEETRWRTFQLAFLLLNVPTVTHLDHPDRTREIGSFADLLWFPTGGGKTEAYLGVAAYAIAVRRLRGEVEGHLGDGGVTVIMRYTLRLLTLQQFQRAATLVCVLEFLRKDVESAGRWGEEPFRIGLWVGNRATPGSTKHAAEWLAAFKGKAAWDSGRGSSSPLQLTNCPWCGARLGPDNVTVETYDKGHGRTYLYCRDAACIFNQRHADGEGIPVLTVDEEIYRYRPTVLLATVDKFAQMPWRGQVQSLFGPVEAHCERHGWLSPDAECSGTHPKKGRLAATKPLPVPANGFRPPDLVIQDELHLISGPLGTLVGLYETAVDELCAWSVGDRTVRPKVIASTATTRRAAEQVHHLFARDVQVFPPSGLDIDDNFFARRRKPSAETAARRYIGVCSPGRSRPAVLIRVYVAMLTAAQGLWNRLDEADKHLADPYLTLVGYFNSLRELGGMRRLVDDDVITRAFRVERADRPGLEQRVLYPEAVQELTSRIRSSDIPAILDQLEVPFRAGKPEKGAVKPLSIVLATNMLSVGVDVQRLGLMAVSGQPKATAEYIQATSRVGRRDPGLVCTVLNWARPRDLSHYEQFEHYHATFYRHVEALSVTPFAPRALDRGLTGVVASLVRLEQATYNPNRGAGEVKGAGQFSALTDAIADRARNTTFPDSDHVEIGTQVRQAVAHRLDEWGAEAARPNRKLGYKSAPDGVTVALFRQPGREPWELFTLPVSMREVEPGVGLVLNPSSAEDLPDWEFRLPDATLGTGGKS